MLKALLDRPTFGGADSEEEDRVAAVAARAAIDEARERNERGVEALALTTAVLGFAAIAWRGTSVDGGTILPNLAVTVVFGSVYAASLLRGGRRTSTRLFRWRRMALEVSAVTAITVINLRHSPEFALTSGAHYAYFLAISTSTLRLDPHVAAASAGLSMLMHAGLFAWCRLFTDMPPEAPAVHPATIGFRLAAMALTGGVGWLLAHTLREKTMKVATETLARERVRATFGSYVDERVVQQVLSGTLSTGPERRAITVLFLDIRSFTSFAESRDPVEVFRSLHLALDAFSAEIQRQGGIVNKFLGDGLLALFGAPETQLDHPRRAVRAALEIAGCAKRLSDQGAFPGLNIGIGIHTGEAMVGNLGGARREYTAIGDVVNVASRVEALNKELGTSILVTEPVRAALGPDAEVRAFPSVSVRGKKEPISLFEIQRVPHTGERAAVGAETPVGRVRVS